MPLLRILLDVTVVNNGLSAAWHSLFIGRTFVNHASGEDGRHGRVGGLNAQNQARTAFGEVSAFPAGYCVTSGRMGTLYSDDIHGMHHDTYNFT
jgi:hypothetical protein